MEWFHILGYFGIAYAILYTSSKVIFSIMSLFEIRIYFWRYDHVIEEHELKEHLAKNKHDLPLISVISPAYNEGVLIIDTVSSFLNQSYQNKEIIVCSDGGTDETLDKLIEYFELVEIEDTFVHSIHISHKPIHRYFKSTNPKYKDLIVLDKENGGKADAQNAGVAIARGEIVTIIDADSILEKYALIHLADIFEREGRVIGIGTPIGVVNDCNIGPDGVDDASVPKSFWAKIQVIEYMRSFLLGRMFAQRYRGLQIVSGAFGVYKKWIIEAVNGYTTGSLAEDMDIDGKIWRYIDSNKLRYRIRYIPEAFCWSEVPDNFKSLSSQRDRWARGMTETIWKNKDLFFNPKYKMLGLFSYPYYVFFEWLTPFLEIAGIIYFIIGASLGWFSFLILEHIFLLYWGVGIILNISALTVEAFTRGHYKNRKTLLRLSFYAIIEPLFFHWINSYLYVLGNLKLLFLRKKGWGEMERVGLKKSGAESKPAKSEPDNPLKEESEIQTIPEPVEYPILAAQKPLVPDYGNEDSDGNEIEEQLEESTPASHAKTSWLKIVLIALVVVLASGATWYYAYYIPKQESERQALIQAEQKQADLKKEELEQTRLRLEEEALERQQLDSLAADSVAINLNVSTDHQISVQHETSSSPIPVGSIDTVLEQTGRYYVIIASVINSDFVMTHARKLTAAGVECKIIPGYTKRNFNLLSIAESDSLEEAQRMLDALKPEYGNEIWVLKY